MSFDTDRQKILIVDDQSENIRILLDALGDELQIIVAKNGQTALKKAGTYLPDLILLDIMMPGMDGFEVCTALKQDHRTKSIPVIFITATDDYQNEERGLKLGAIDYIRKPFHPSVAVARIYNHLELKRKTDLLESLARIDGLTEIYNRRAFDETLEQYWKAAARTSSPLSLILIDIDFFKNFNDHYGHAKGDLCLKQVASLFKRTLRRPQDFVARYGGEEFVFLLPETDAAGVATIGRSILDAVRHLHLEHNNSPIEEYLTVSLGGSTCFPENEASSVSLIKKADSALYFAKENGRNCFHAYQNQE